MGRATILIIIFLTGETVVDNGNELYEGDFNRQRTVNDWVIFFANGLDQCMNGNLNVNFDGGGKKGKKSLKKRRRNRKTTHRKKNATKRR
jgi:hypothetical protein